MTNSKGGGEEEQCEERLKRKGLSTEETTRAEAQYNQLYVRTILTTWMPLKV